MTTATLIRVSDTYWRSTGICVAGKVDRDVWVTSNAGGNKRLARALCNRCDVQRDCAITAINLYRSGDSPTGTWAGVYCPDDNLRGRRDRAIAALEALVDKAAR